MSKKMTPDEAARQLSEAFDAGETYGLNHSLVERAESPWKYSLSLWGMWLERAWADGLKVGRQSRRAELSQSCDELNHRDGVMG